MERFGLRRGRSGLGCVAAYVVARAAAMLAGMAAEPMAAAILISVAVALQATLQPRRHGERASTSAAITLEWSAPP